VDLRLAPVGIGELSKRVLVRPRAPAPARPRLPCRPARAPRIA